jgi:LmbE family N-acetylglucosaminyl deacetylase
MVPMATFLSIAPHPDDEVLGAGPLSLLLQGAGHDVHVYAASLGRPGQHERRTAEASAAAAVGGWTLHLPQHPAQISSGDNLATAHDDLVQAIGALSDELRPDVLIGPGVHDAHHGHEVVGRAIRDAGSPRAGLRWWSWQMWGHLPAVNLVATYDQDVLDAASAALSAYSGENTRNSYQDMLHGAARLNAALAPERAFGFGSSRTWTDPYAAMYCELVSTGDGWILPGARVLDPAAPLQVGAGARWPAWLHHDSPYLR